MDSSISSADLVAMYQAELHLCKVKPGENILVFTDPRFPHPEYPPAAFAAARRLGANAYVLTSQSDQRHMGPIQVSSSGRYIVDHCGKPFFWLGDTQWELFRAYSLADAQLILENRKRKGFTHRCSFVHTS
jgi:hypothetical protein